MPNSLLNRIMEISEQADQNFQSIVTCIDSAYALLPHVKITELLLEFDDDLSPMENIGVAIATPTIRIMANLL
jgi:hypothetical protein